MINFLINNLEYLLTIVSIFLNILLFLFSRKEKMSLKHFMQENYNAYYSIARSTTRTKHNDFAKEYLTASLHYIEGIADVQRNNIIAYSRVHLSFTPFYEHPQFPGESQPEEIMSFETPEEYRERNNSTSN